MLRRTGSVAQEGLGGHVMPFCERERRVMPTGWLIKRPATRAESKRGLFQEMV